MMGALFRVAAAYKVGNVLGKRRFGIPYPTLWRQVDDTGRL
jgi:hypothetical protein